MTTTVLVISLLAGVCVIWYVVVSLLICAQLEKRGEKVSYIWIRLMLPSYVSRYRNVTARETGRTGRLFYHWIVSINLALALVLVALFVSRP